jgi:transposase-like protein
MSTDNELGFELYRTGKVRRLSPTCYAIQVQEDGPSVQVEFRNGVWVCDCGSPGENCPHRYAARMSALVSRTASFDDGKLTCRSCGSPDISGCGFRYNSHGISRRFRCNECFRKFSIPYVETGVTTQPSGSLWLLAQVAMLTSKLNELLAELTKSFSRLTEVTSTLPGQFNIAEASRDAEKASRQNCDP